HRVKGRGLARSSGERRALFRNQLVSLLMHESIRTTEAKARELQPLAENVIALAREDNDHNRARAASILANSLMVRKLFEEIGPRYGDRTGGYTRIYKLGRRPGDAALVCQLEIVES
ncbi:MAG: 50S ribosomal protein L17, partial [Chloroflexota bacterium]|nr:50S ribosomal protein L17 [Chloroflexota bacterium]